ncbi:checkpoint serine/threonine-protein kinase [Naviculisporaceae sp. PSN 640]
MASSNEPVDFDIIEGQKENIQALPSGRSARKLAELFSPSPLHKMATPTPSDTKNVNDCIRAEYEAEIENISESDDPLDVYDRYVRWTLDAYPSAQASPQSQLHTLLERATKAFVSSAQYKNDPRYLKLWLHYIHFFSDSPRETFVFLSRHAIGENLALFYEEYAAWLEGAGRWAQAEEVYKLGIEREARPTSRLVRKFGEFEQRRAQQPETDVDGPSSPAIPTVRPVLGVKVDPFAAAAPRDPQAPRPNNGLGVQAPPKAGKSKLQIFSDADAPAAAAPAMSSRGLGTRGWDSIGSLSERKKENVMEPKPWAGETLKAGGKKNTGPKLEVFRDANLARQLSKSHIPIHHSQMQKTINPLSGKIERVFVDLRVVYPTPKEPGTELSFEEVWARNRGWLDRVWDVEPQVQEQTSILDENMVPGVENLHMDENYASKTHSQSQQQQQKLMVHRDTNSIRLDENGAPIYPKESKPKKKKVIEVNETQIIKAKLDSPSRPKMMKRRQTAEPTMTLHTKAATDDIYDIFNAPLKPAQPLDEGSDYESDDYTSGAESTTRNITTSEAGDVDDIDEEEEEEGDEEDPEVEASDVKSVSEWSDFSTRRHIPDVVGVSDPGENDTQMSDLIDMGHQAEHPSTTQDSSFDDGPLAQEEEEDDGAPRTRTVFVPIPPEDYVPTRRPYRDPAEVANNRLPFMTPITERTESSLEFTSHDLLAKTPCKNDDRRCIPEEDEDGDEAEGSDDLGPMSSPLRDVSDDDGLLPKPKVPQALLPKTKQPLAPAPIKALAPKQPLAPKAPLVPKGPIIKDAQCNPVDDAIRNEILANIQPPLSSYDGFYDHRNEKYEKGGEIRKFIKAISKPGGGGKRRSSADTNKTLNSLAVAPVIEFADVEGRSYTVKKELGKGAFAPVYLVENSHPTLATAGGEVHDENDENSHQTAMMGRGRFALPHHIRHEKEALKMESPPTAWEFYMMRLAHARLGPQHRATASLSPALEMHLYQDEAFLFLPYYSHGTLLDVVNFFRGEVSGSSGGVMDETLAMFFTVELFRTVEALHSKGICHGDLKVDNCLLRLGDLNDNGLVPLTGPWKADGSDGWASRGITLIDFGRGIDMRAFRPDVAFIADWKTSAQDCAEMREGRPWTWQIDYHGLAGIVHCLLFGKYIEAVRCGDRGFGPGGKRYNIRESLKRYWQTEIWGDCFDLLLNPGCAAVAEGEEMPVLRGMRSVRERMERWLEANGEKGVGLRSLMGRIEVWAGAGKGGAGRK